MEDSQMAHILIILSLSKLILRPGKKWVKRVTQEDEICTDKKYNNQP